MTKQEILAQIHEMTQIWYEYVGLDHHKDRDCHWYITQEWSYGNKPEWRVQHFGYIADDFDFSAESYETALARLHKELNRMIVSEYHQCVERATDKDEWGTDWNKAIDVLSKWIERKP